MFFNKLRDKIKNEREKQDRARKIKIIEDRKAKIINSGALESVINILSIKNNNLNQRPGISSDKMDPYIFSTEYEDGYLKKLEIPSVYDGTIDHLESKLKTSIGIKDGDIELYLYNINSFDTYPYYIQIIINDETVFEGEARERDASIFDLWPERNLNQYTFGRIYNVSSTDWIKSIKKFNKLLKKDNKRVLEEKEKKEKDGKIGRRKKYEDALIKKSKL